MSSYRRIAASRANDRRSPGPVTDAGNARSSQNALRHGLLAHCLVLAEESPEVFQSLRGLHIDRLQPADELELEIVEEMVAAAWRMRRSWAVATYRIDTAAASAEMSAALDRITAAVTALASSPALPFLPRYETRIHLAYRRAINNLLLSRAAVPNEPSPISEHPVIDLAPHPPRNARLRPDDNRKGGTPMRASTRCGPPAEPTRNSNTLLPTA